MIELIKLQSLNMLSFKNKVKLWNKKGLKCFTKSAKNNFPCQSKVFAESKMINMSVVYKINQSSKTIRNKP